MKKKSFCLSLLLGILAGSGGASFYPSESLASFQPQLPHADSLEIVKSRLSDFTIKFVEVKNGVKNHEDYTLSFNRQILTLISDINQLRIESEKVKRTREKITSYEKILERNQKIVERRQQLVEKYNGATPETISIDLKGSTREYKKKLEAEQKDNAIQAAITAELLLSGEENLRVLDISEISITHENSVCDEAIKQLSLTIDNDLEKKLKTANEAYNMLMTIKLKTVYHLPEPFKGGDLISPHQLMRVLSEKMGIEERLFKDIDPQRFVKFALRTLELPIPCIIGETPNVVDSYISQLGILIERYKLRIRENAFDIQYFTSLQKEINDKNPDEEKEKKLLARFIKLEPENEHLKGRETFAKFFIDLGYNPHESNLRSLIAKAIPADSHGLLQAICTGLNNYEGCSFLCNDEVPHPVRVAEKIVRNEHNIDSEFYGCSRTLARNEFNLEVLRVILENFQHYNHTAVNIKKHDSEEDIY